MGLNDMQWREKLHLNVNGMNRNAQSMKKWMSIIKFRQDTHTTQYLSVCHRTCVVKSWKKELTAHLVKMSVIEERCVLTHAE